MENCIFCKIANGEIPAATLYEDENFSLLLLLFSLYPSGKQMQVFFFIYVFLSVLFLKI